MAVRRVIKRRLKIVQQGDKLPSPRLVLARPVRNLFQIVEPRQGENYWEVKISDVLIGDEPVFRFPLSAKNPRDVEINDLVAAGQRECNEGTGRVYVTEYRNAVPIFAAQYVVGTFFDGHAGRFCVWSTDQIRAPIIDLTMLVKTARAKLMERERHVEQAPGAEKEHQCS